MCSKKNVPSVKLAETVHLQMCVCKEVRAQGGISYVPRALKHNHQSLADAEEPLREFTGCLHSVQLVLTVHDSIKPKRAKKHYSLLSSLLHLGLIVLLSLQ